MTQPWSIVSIDMIGPYTKSRSGNTFAIVAVDLYTKYFEIRPVRKQNGRTIVKFLKYLIGRWGIPRHIITDNGRDFINTDVKTLLTENDVDFTPTPIYHPQANHVGRYNRTIKPLIITYINDNQKVWDEN